MKRFLIILGALMAAGAAAYAGGLADALVEAVPTDPQPVAEPGSSLPAWVIPAVIIALLVGFAVAGDDDEDDGGPTYQL